MSAQLTANDPLADGVKSYSITSSDSASPVNTGTDSGFSVTVDTTPPTISAAVVQKSAGGTGGYIKQGASYYVYANVTDASGVASASANTGSFDTGETAAPLSAGSWTVDGTTYSHRSALLTANATVAEGSYGFSITATDTLGQAATRSSDSVQVDNTAPTATDVQTANVAANAGRPEQDDTLTYTFSEPIEPSSILAGWTGAATDVVVRIANSASDTLTIFDSPDTTQLPFGSLDLGRSDYVSAQQEFGKNGSKSRMSRSGNSVTIVLGQRAANVSTTAAGTGPGRRRLRPPTAPATRWRRRRAARPAPPTRSSRGVGVANHNHSPLARRAGARIAASAAVTIGLAVWSVAELRAEPPRPGETRASGVLSQSSSHDGSAILTAQAMKPGDTASGSVTIANTGDLAGEFSLFASNLRGRASRR